ncbi:MAG: hypothetical protein H6633_22245 [Anaerolineales bacterium]|nr:hypothetical protein [Anaerolineales bacterium]
MQSVELTMAAHNDRLKREVKLILENWSSDATDTLDYIAQLAPAKLRHLFPISSPITLSRTYRRPIICRRKRIAACGRTWLTAQR